MIFNGRAGDDLARPVPPDLRSGGKSGSRGCFLLERGLAFPRRFFNLESAWAMDVAPRPRSGRNFGRGWMIACKVFVSALVYVCGQSPDRSG